MFPFLINTIPENGSVDIDLNQEIELEFDGKIDLTDKALATAVIKLINYNSDNEVEEVEGITLKPASPPIAPDENGKFPEDYDPNLDSLVRVHIPKSATGGNRYEGLTKYKLQISGLRSPYGSKMPVTIELRFTTKANSIKDYYDEIKEIPDEFRVIRSYPKEDSIIDPKIIKVQCSKEISQLSSLTEVMLIEGYDIDEALFIGEGNLIDESRILVDGNFLEIDPPIFKAATQYSILIKGITDIDENDISEYFFSFTTPFESMYSDVKSVMKSKAVSILLKDASEGDISSLIHDNSKLAEFIAEQGNNTGIDWINPPLFVGEYVKYKTQYDIIFDKFIELSGNPTSKQLKDLTIEYGYSLADLLKMADALKLRYQYWEDFIKGKTNRGSARPAAFRRGEQIDEDPDFMSRKLRDIEGNKEW